jgi:hypothetical protein
MTHPTLQKLSQYLIHHSYPSYNENCGKCAKAVRVGIEFAFDPKTLIRNQAAKNYGPSLEKFGFKKIASFPKGPTDYQVQVGDVAIINYEPYGHICVYCEGSDPEGAKKVKCWISDFKQKDMYGGPIRKKTPPFDIYRYNF